MAKITIFKTIDSDSQAMYFEIDEVLDRIKRGLNRQLIQKIRSEQNKKKRDSLKKNLLWICFSGEFSKRNNESMIKHSGFMCIDFDGIPANEMKMWRNRLQFDTRTYSLFTSPSGNGLKVIWKIPECQTNDEHNRRFDAIAKEFSYCKYFDLNVKGWSCVCFESFDPDLYLNSDAEIFSEIAEPIKIETPVHETPVKNENIQQTFDNLVKWFEHNHNMRKGNRNKGAFVFASGVAEYLTESDAEPMLTSYIMSNVEQDPSDQFTTDECRTCIKQAYKLNPFPRKKMRSAADANSPVDFQEQEITIPEDETSSGIPESDQPAPEQSYPEIFWYVGKRAGYCIDFLPFKLFLQGNGYFKYRFSPEDISFIRIRENIIELVTVDNIRDFVLNYIQGKNDAKAYNLFAAESKFEKKYLAFLDIKEPDFIRDTKNESWVFFRNTAVKITKDELTEIPYIDLAGTGFLWKTQIIDRDFSVVEDYKCDFSDFLFNICAKNVERLRSLCSGMGYFMHRYKNPSTVRVLIPLDEQIDGKPNGGTGKTLLFQAMSKIRVTVFINAKTYDPNKEFSLQRVRPDTDNVVFDDPSKSFKFEYLFSNLSTGWPIRRLYEGEIFMPPSESPKIGIPTNYALKGSSVSYKRRKFEIEIHPYYTEDYQPVDDFKKTFWDEWDEIEYLKFDNLMLNCIKLWLTEGFIKVDYINLRKNQFIAETSEEFADYANEHLFNNSAHHRNNCFKDFINEFPGSYCKSANMFYDWMREWGKFNEWETKDGGSGRMYIIYGTGEEPLKPAPGGQGDLPF